MEACPYVSSLQQGDSAPQQPQPQASCPLGFGSSSSSGVKLTPFHCLLCKCLLHDCVVAQPCGHKYCSFCIQRFADCPTCGADVVDVVADAQTQGGVGRGVLGVLGGRAALGTALVALGRGRRRGGGLVHDDACCRTTCCLCTFYPARFAAFGAPCGHLPM